MFENESFEFNKVINFELLFKEDNKKGKKEGNKYNNSFFNINKAKQLSASQKAAIEASGSSSLSVSGSFGNSSECLNSTNISQSSKSSKGKVIYFTEGSI